MEQIDADIAVISGGSAGMAAAVAAAQMGAKVLVFEKASSTGGAGNMAMGLFAAESKFQRMKQIALSRDQAFRILMEYNHWHSDARLIKAYIDKSASTIDWLEKMGVEFIEPVCHSPGFSFTWHIVKPSSGRAESGAAAAMMKVLTDNAGELGVKILLQTPAKKILMKDGRVAGVIAEDMDGKDVQTNVRAAIVATGGFGDNPEWIKKYTGFEWGRDMFSHRIPGLVGDGLRMAWEAGAARTEMIMHMIYSTPEVDAHGPVYVVFRQPNLMVNLSGERFINEEIMVNDTYTGNAIAKQKKRLAYIIFDEAIKNKYVEEGLDLPVWFFYPFFKPENFDAEIKKLVEKGSESVFVANAIGELANKAGIASDAFCATVNEYNKACDSGRDEVMAKDIRYLRPIKQPPFYAAKFVASGFGTLGGIRVNYKTQALNNELDVIPGLYAAGADAESIYGDSYAYLLPGNTLGFAINSGRIAGENAAKFVSGSK